MARPKRELSMARCAASAVLAAIEIYNKPTVEYHEQTFALLMVNAWEILLKARLLQQAGGKVTAIYCREDGSRRYQRDSRTREPLTLGLTEVLGQAALPREVRDNLSGLVEVRNRAAHLGVLAAGCLPGSPSLRNCERAELPQDVVQVVRRSAGCPIPAPGRIPGTCNRDGTNTHSRPEGTARHPQSPLGILRYGPARVRRRDACGRRAQPWVLRGREHWVHMGSCSPGPSE